MSFPIKIHVEVLFYIIVRPEMWGADPFLTRMEVLSAPLLPFKPWSGDYCCCNLILVVAQLAGQV